MLKGFLSNPRASLGFTPIVRPFLSIQFTPYTKSSTKFALFPLNIHRQYASRNRRNPIELTYSEEMSASKRKRQPVIQPPSPISTIASQVTQNDPDILDAEEALMASPSASNDLALSEEFQVESNGSSSGFSDAPDSDQEDLELVDRKIQKKPGKAVKKVTPKKPTKQARLKKNDEDEEPSSEDEIAEALQRPPAVNHEYEPIPWKGRIGYACLNTYLRDCKPPIFCSRTCRIATILEHDKQDGEGAGMKYVKSLGYANAADLSKMIEWNERYGIKFLRLSSEMFPFASHHIYGYTLEHAAEPLRKAGELAMKYGHRLTMHPGQFTQLGSPRPEVITASIRDLEFHCEYLDRLQLKGQADRDAVMIIHMGGIYGDKESALARFKETYTTRLSEGIKRRLVLENDDVCYTIEDILPTCQELGIPLVLDWHHHNILHGNLREGSYDAREVVGAAIRKTWTDKGITQKQHYSEPREGAVTNKERRRHSARVFKLPPCADDMDLMIEAKDKEQAVFELMKVYKLPGWEKINEVIPHERQDENKPIPKKRAKKQKKTKKQLEAEAAGEIEVVKEEEEPVVELIPEQELGMGGPERRVYWPEGHEDWLRPKKREIKKKVKEEDTTAGETQESALEETPKKKPRMSKQPKRKTPVKSEVKEEEENDKMSSALEATPEKKLTKVKASGKRKAAPTKAIKKEAAIEDSIKDVNMEEADNIPPPSVQPKRKAPSKTKVKTEEKEPESDLQTRVAEADKRNVEIIVANAKKRALDATKEKISKSGKDGQVISTVTRITTEPSNKPPSLGRTRSSRKTVPAI